MSGPNAGLLPKAWQRMAEATGKPFAEGGAYSSDCYADWTGCVTLLRERGATLDGARTLLRSKHMRWCSDNRTGKYGTVSVAELARYLDTHSEARRMAGIADAPPPLHRLDIEARYRALLAEAERASPAPAGLRWGFTENGGALTLLPVEAPAPSVPSRQERARRAMAEINAVCAEAEAESPAPAGESWAVMANGALGLVVTARALRDGEDPNGRTVLVIMERRLRAERCSEHEGRLIIGGRRRVNRKAILGVVLTIDGKTVPGGASISAPCVAPVEGASMGSRCAALQAALPGAPGEVSGLECTVLPLPGGSGEEAHVLRTPEGRVPIVFCPFCGVRLR